MAVEANSNGVEVSQWLKSLPVAPEYHPTLAEFQDPIAYIFKIEKEASKFGICKIVPPVPSSSKKTAIANLNRSLLARSSDPESGPVFSTRRQQIGFCPRKQNRPVQKPVWQSGESYTFGEFEAKAKGFEKGYLKKYSKKCLTALEIETLYWKATLDKPFTVEYANDMPGSAFIVKKDKGGELDDVNGHISTYKNNVTVGETEWNMRGVSRAKGSLLRFMKEEIPGVTSPMVYIAMLFSWFAWHVEDHDLHSLNYLHMGAGKTWYGVPREAAVAFEEVIRMHGYGGEINPLATFATLGEKTTVMSPEVLVHAGVPCCRLVQNPGEFVVTFPRAYHSGFSHGFNCAEAANIATPEWLMVAKDAAVRRASINCPPMVSHFQLLYDLALSLCSRVPMNIHKQPRSSRLKDKKKGEGEILVKDLFVQDVVQNNNLFHILGKGSSVVILPRVSMNTSSYPKGGSKSKEKARSFPSLGSPDLMVKTRKSIVSDDIMLDRNQANQVKQAHMMKGKYSPVCAGKFSFLSRANHVISNLGSQSMSLNTFRDGDFQSDRFSTQGFFSCVTCGILCFASVAVIQPTETASQYLMSGDCSILSDWAGVDGLVAINEGKAALESSTPEWVGVRTSDGLFDIPIQSADQIQPSDGGESGVANSELRNESSSLGLLAMTYGDSSDSEDVEDEADIPVEAYETDSRDSSPKSSEGCDNVGYAYCSSSIDFDPPCSPGNCVEEVSLRSEDSYVKHGFSKTKLDGRINKTHDCCLEVEISNPSAGSNHNLGAQKSEAAVSTPLMPSDSNNKQFSPVVDEDSSRMHIFCLQHAVQVEKQLRPIGGADVVLLCHPDYPMLEAQAKKLAEELGNDHCWNDVSFREASKEDEEMIQLAIDSEEAIHENGDWAVKLGINLYYSASLSRTPLYSKQIPYNATIYNAFGRKISANTSAGTQLNRKWSGRQKKVTVAGKWCGKVWTSNQVHPLLAEGEPEEEDQARNFSASLRSDSMFERPPEGHENDEPVSTSSKSRRKRKTSAETRQAVRAKSVKAEDPDEALESPLVPSTRQKVNLRNKRMRKGTPEAQINSEMNYTQSDSHTEDELEGGPSTRLRKRAAKPSNESGRKVEAKQAPKKQHKSTVTNKGLATKAAAHSNNSKMREEEQHPCDVEIRHKGRVAKKGSAIKAAAHSKTTKTREAMYPCDIENCTMGFGSKQELVMHKKNICPVKGCGKKFFSHKYLVQHRRVHDDDRPLKCPWKGCKMTFKWAWARTEHIRVHTGARPYVCTETGCGQTFRFVSDFSRHKRKTGHSSKKVKR